MRGQGLRCRLAQLGVLHHAQFDSGVGGLVRREGLEDSQQVGGGGLGADVEITDPFGRRWVIQCKHEGATRGCLCELGAHRLAEGGNL
ncbi:restriction endonuclease [Streptomyces sp. NPDC093982]|uniref:restriction endonuclease n=1 Tax=Streptomyces sp. NPDC093982 TaxID=3155077 RepID=UPI00344182E9